MTDRLTFCKGITIATDFCLSLYPNQFLMDVRSAALGVDLCIGLSKSLSAAYRTSTPARHSSFLKAQQSIQTGVGDFAEAMLGSLTQDQFCTGQLQRKRAGRLLQSSLLILVTGLSIKSSCCTKRSRASCKPKSMDCKLHGMWLISDSSLGELCESGLAELWTAQHCHVMHAIKERWYIWYIPERYNRYKHSWWAGHSHLMTYTPPSLSFSSILTDDTQTTAGQSLTISQVWMFKCEFWVHVQHPPPQPWSSRAYQALSDSMSLCARGEKHMSWELTTTDCWTHCLPWNL